MRWLWWVLLTALGCTLKPTTTLKLKEASLYELESALLDSTVERRLSNLLSLFSDGHFVSTPTLMALAGIGQPQQGERDDQERFRELLNEIAQMTRVGDWFVIRLKHQRDCRQKIYVYGQNNQDGRKRHEWDVFVSKNAKIFVKPTRNGIKVNAKGIRIGYGLLKLEIPSMRIKGDYATVLGVKVNLSKK